MILSPDKRNQETEATEEIPTSGGTEARSEKAGKCRKRRKTGLSGRGPNLVETARNYTTSDHDQYLCEELIIEIFTRLPAKSLLRFRSVSKSLYSCIGSPGFIRMHSSRSPHKVLIRYYVICSKGTNKNFYSLLLEDRLRLCRTRGYNGIKEVEFPYGIDCKCVGSCNGIFYMFNTDDVSVLWNPSVRRKLIVPRCPERIAHCYPGFICSSGLGFGFDTISDDYKIVSLPLFGDTGLSSYVYTTKTGAWCKIASPAPWFYRAKSRGCFVNGVLHWVVKYKKTRSDKVAHFYILTFNLSTHVFGKIVLPEPKWETKQLTTIQGSLAAISTKHDGDSWIWVMKEYNNAASWFVFFKSKTNQVIRQLHSVLQPTSDGDLFIHTCEGYQVYDPKIGTRSRLQNLNSFYDGDIFYSSIIDMETCVESLQLLEKGEGLPRLPTISSYS